MNMESMRELAARPWTLALGAIALFAVGVATSRTAAHDTRAAVRVEPRTADELAMTLALADDLWSENLSVRDPVVVVLARAGLEQLRASGVPARIVVDDIEAVARDERERLRHRVRDATGPGWYADYRDLDEINGRMATLAAAHPALVRLRSLGASVEGRPIRALEISHGGKLGIVLDGGHHAREWISAMVPICIADRLATAYDGDPRVRKILDAVRFFVVPLVNPDGYHYAWTVDRYWRKNRRGGYGVDLSRNYGVAWGQAGSSGDRGSPNYRGERAFSEPETQAVRGLFEHEDIAAHVDFHSFSQVIVYPWSYQRAEPADRDRFGAVADRMSTAMVAAQGKRYPIRPGSQLTVGASGTATDWSYGERGALAFLIELRPSSSADGGFVLPPEQIVPTCDESFAGVLALAESMVRERP